MDYFTLDALRRGHPAWRMLAADHAPLIISFLHQQFVTPNVRTLSQQELVSKLEDHLFHLRLQLGDAAFPRSAEAYLDEWASDAHGWLRKYYLPGGDEVHFDITPSTEKAIDWLASLKQRQFVATESRLMTVFELLRQMIEGSELDPRARISELERRKAQIDAEIARVESGQLDIMDSTRIKDRFLQMASMARGLLSDFREVDQNFRNLDRAARERIATWEGSKGDLLSEIFGERDAISDSDQGQSFRAFWDFLMSPAKQEELSQLLASVFALPAVRELEPEQRLRRVHYDWMAAGEIAQRTVALLSAQLRRYLDDQTWLENKRIMQLVRAVEQRALAVRTELPEGPFMELSEFAPEVDLPFERPLFAPPMKARISEHRLEESAAHVRTDALYEQVYVDKVRLAARIRRTLQTRPQASLAEIVAAEPLEQGLAELVAYLSLAAEDEKALIDDARTQTLAWTDPSGVVRQATLPLVLFVR